jgi:hypothetical protein
MYGVSEDQAKEQLNRFLHEDLKEPEAELDALYLEKGRWQSHVNKSQRGIRVVFLEQHNGQIAPGHMTVDSHPEAIQKDW